MASKRTGGSEPRMIRCEYCGEDYASSYKHCPFCDEMDEDYEDGEERPQGGKRLAGGQGGGYGYGGGPSPLKIIATVVSLALIIAAVIIVISIIKPLVDRGKTGLPEETPPAGVQATETPGVDGALDPEGTLNPDPTPDASAPDPDSSAEPTIPPGQTATGFTLSKSDFTLNNQWPDPITLTVTFIPAGSTGTITWTSSNPDVATVDENGKVSHGTKTGSATITATMAGGITQTCTVYNSVTSSSGSSSSANSGSNSSSSLSLSRTDFTLEPGESWQVTVSGTSSTPTWSIGNSSVATVSSNGTVTNVGSGTTTLTCSVDGQTLTCIVRCK